MAATVSTVPASFAKEITPEALAWLQSIESSSNATSGDLALYSKILRTVNPQTGTSYTLASTDSGNLVTLNNGSAITLTVPSGLDVGCQIDLAQIGAGQVSVVAGAGVTIVSEDSKLKLAKQGSAATLVQYASNTFLLTGSLSV